MIPLSVLYVVLSKEIRPKVDKSSPGSFPVLPVRTQNSLFFEIVIVLDLEHEIRDLENEIAALISRPKTTQIEM
jgi:hypothetical protein